MYPKEVKEILEAFGNATIDKIALNGKKNRLYIRDSEKRVHSFFTEGDCCSTSWVENLEFQGTVLGRKLIDVESELLGEDEWHTGKLIKKADEPMEGFDDYAQILAYSTSLKTEGGALKIEYRNESNGYYGGSLQYEGLVDHIPDGINIIEGDV